MSCDVTERYTPRTPSQYCQIKYGGPFVRLLQLQPKVAENPSLEQEEYLCACHSENLLARRSLARSFPDFARTKGQDRTTREKAGDFRVFNDIHIF